MILPIILLTLSIIILDIALCEVSIFTHIVFLFVLVNFFYWFKRYKVALISGLIASVIIDLAMQKQFGESLFALVVPILILSIFDNILRIETKISSIIFAVLCTIISIFISDFLFNLLYLSLSINANLLVRRILFSSGFLIIISLIFGNLIEVDRSKGKIL